MLVMHSTGSSGQRAIVCPIQCTGPHYKYCVILLSPWLWNHFLHPYNMDNGSEQLIVIELELNEILRTRYLASYTIYHEPGINIGCRCDLNVIRWGNRLKATMDLRKWSKSSQWLSLVQTFSSGTKHKEVRASRGLTSWRPNTHFLGEETEDGAEPWHALGQCR